MTVCPYNDVVAFCECGCGEPAPIAIQSYSRLGHIKGQPIRFISGHNARRPAIDRFWESVNKRGPDDCWPWNNRAVTEGGYGRLYVGSDVGVVRAHRFAYEQFIGPISGNLCVLHRCDNPPCCNPAHLFLGTRVENNADRDAKGRTKGTSRPGAQNPNAKLSQNDVDQLRALAQRVSVFDLAQRFGISRSQAYRIVVGESWK